jgi:hypothetical protein
MASFGFVCEYNHYVRALEPKNIVGLDKPHGGWLNEKHIRWREQRDAECRELFAQALGGEMK